MGREGWFWIFGWIFGCSDFFCFFISWGGGFFLVLAVEVDYWAVRRPYSVYNLLWHVR